VDDEASGEAANEIPAHGQIPAHVASSAAYWCCTPFGAPKLLNHSSGVAPRIGTRDWNPEIGTFHALRHTHASQLIDAGVDIVTIRKRLGHAKPDITLRIYAHLFRKDDGKAAAAINAILGS
jgi:integrase